jgi:flavin reductase (DIM6/NTAB) family NADH-FMN oxidoreductase RutF
MMDDITKIDAPKVEQVSKDVFLEAMSRVPQAVFIVTTDGAEGRAGITATAVTSVSADPPSLLICLNAANFSTMIFYKNKRITVNSLQSEQIEVAGVFGKSAAKGLINPTPEQLRQASEKRFNLDDWEFGEAPILRGARAVFECEISEVKLVDTHLVVFAKVLNVRLGAVKSALVYLERDYKAV